MILLFCDVIINLIVAQPVTKKTA